MNVPSDGTLHARYPGPRSFRDEESERRLFFGRDQAIESLTHRIRAARLVALFGKSGLGKTSLLQAGVYSKLRDEYDYLPIPVRFSQPGINPVETIIEAALAADGKKGIEVLSGARDSLWEFFRTTDFWRGDTLFTPVLVLDQFEEIFTLQSTEFRRELAAGLHDLTSRRLSADLKLRIVLSLREEYLGALEELVAEVPDILETRFRLAPLDVDDTRKAIEDPAAFESQGIYRSQPFRYDENTLKGMLDRLTNRKGEFEPFQLQVLCQYVEEQVIKHEQSGATGIEVNRELLPPEAMTRVLANFYRDSLAAIPKRRQRLRARKLCEQGLLSLDDKRVSLEASGLIRSYRLQAQSLKTLVDKRLLRKDTRPGLEGFYYELSHDSLIEPLRLARMNRRKYIRTFLVTFVFLQLLALGVTVESLIWLEKYSLTVEALTTRWKYRLGIPPLLPKLVRIPAGSFMMGSGDGAPDEQPVRKVHIDKPFYLSKTEVTFDQYYTFVAMTGHYKPQDHKQDRGEAPITGVDWQDANDYALWLDAITGSSCRLPSEAEWEYAARAGTMAQFALPAPEGSNDLSGYANCKGCGSSEHVAAEFKDQIGTQKLPVASFPANAWGLRDMHGNVWEWVQDCWHDSYEGAPGDGSAWLEENDEGCGIRILRGGSWFFSQDYARSTNRFRSLSILSNNITGFRVLCSSPISDTDH
ncbi:MAG: SUMF1/EgtB/PvdO family nonheme iron enzyme [Xanthomonadales bacterium]|nr:SUMF1/EgtB/PvdO family nonheme iron enzyme [Xanthomonadales bacterium]